MTYAGKMRVIAIEEHYWDPEVSKHFKGYDSGRRGPLTERLYDLDQIRLKEMDEAGIDLQVLSHGAPSLQKMDAETAVGLARGVNDRLHQACRAHPDRFAGFAALPTSDPKAAADELERSVTRLGFKGAMVHGLTNGLFLDDKRFWPIFERARALDVPLYMHPATPHPAVVEAYYKDYIEAYPSILTAGWGFTVETATQAIRLVLSGVFEAYPGLKIILGHLGESLPFSLWRIDQAMSRAGNRGNSFRDTFSAHFWITTSGNFSNPALLCSVMELGIDRIMFSVDWPYVMNGPAVTWLDSVPLSAEDKAKLLHGNVTKLLRL
ncbi:MAG: amidohydrolase [Alphaproteobacteria bacterium]|nr:amidohydrolase [Alphaproteobacteria bacterium]